MQVSLSARGALERRLEVAVPAAEVTQEFEQRLKRVARSARLKGFRPGKAPLPVVRKQFGEQVHAEVVDHLIRSCLAQALREQNLTPAGGPRIEPIAIAPGAELKFAAVFEIMPEVRVKSPEGTEISRPSAVVTEADVDAMVESMRRQRAQFSPADRPAELTDRVTVDYTGLMDGKPFDGGDASDVALVLGNKQNRPELESALIGARAGETRQVSVTFPADMSNATLAGKSAELSVSVKQVEAQSLPPVDDAFCRSFGIEDGSVETLRAEVRASMERELADLVRGRLRAQVLDALYAQNPLEVPRTLIDEQVQQMQLDAARNMGVREASQLPPREPFEDPARRRAALGLILGQIIRGEGLQPDPQRVEARLEELASNYPNPQEARAAYRRSAEAMRQIESAALEEQVIDWFVARAAVRDQPMTFQELTGFGQGS
ncbi:MAG: trigger factor [Steroidobacteraceae bacterium]